MIDVLLEYGDGRARATAVLGPDHMGVNAGRVLETALIECVAQTVAAMKGAERRGGPPDAAPGMLCGAANFRIARRPAAGQPLEIVVQEQKQLGAILLVTGQVLCEGALVAEGELKLYG